MATTKTFSVAFPGPIELYYRGESINVITDPDLTHAEISIHTDADTGPSAAAVNNARVDVAGRRVTINGLQNAAGVSGGVFVAGNSSVVIGGMIAGNVFVDGVKVVPGQMGGTVEIVSPVTVTAHIPAHSSVDLQSNASDLHVHGELNHVILKSVSGDLSCEVANEISMDANSGDVRVDRVRRAARISTVSGDIRVFGDEDARVNASSVSGHITYSRHIDFSGNSVSGSVRSVKQ